MSSYRYFQLALSKDLFVSGSLMNRLVPCLFRMALFHQRLLRLNVMLKVILKPGFRVCNIFLVAFSLPVQLFCYCFVDVHQKK